MVTICVTVENEQDSLSGVDGDTGGVVANISLAIVGGVVSMAHAADTKVIVASTESGSTAFEISRHSTQLSIPVLVLNISAQRHTAVHCGVRPMILATSTDHDTALRGVEFILVDRQILKPGDQYTTISGSQMRQLGSTNMLQVMSVD